MRLFGPAILVLLLQSSGAFACSCLTTGSACNWLRGTEIVFVGRVTEDSGEGDGTGPARMVVEEVLHGLPKNLRAVIVDTGSGTSCYMRLKKDELYVIYGSSETGGRIRRNFCSFSFQLSGNEVLLSALRQAERGGSPRLIGKVQMKYENYNVRGEGAPGVRVIATTDSTRLETSTNDNGEFEFLNVNPGRYHLAVSSPEVFEDPWRWPNQDPAVSVSSCGYQNLFVWPNGRIEGVVRNADGEPLAGVPVQAFIKDRRGELDSSPVREQKTNKDGSYLLSGVPPGEVVIGVNGEEYNDRVAWVPTFYPGTPDRNQAMKLSLGRGKRLTDIDLKLAMPRRPATLRIEAVLEDGNPVTDAGAKLKNLAGVQRVFVPGLESHTDVLAVPVYVGESYIVESFRHSDGRSWEGEIGPVTITGTDVRIRVTLHQVNR